jgi:hypothetical protein
MRAVDVIGVGGRGYIFRAVASAHRRSKLYAAYCKKLLPKAA